MNVDDIVNKIGKGRIAIQGGSHRIEFGPSESEIKTFETAVKFYEKLIRQGTDATLFCIVNDLGLQFEERPKNSGNEYTYPKEYLKILDRFGINQNKVTIFYESTLRNRARKGPDKALKIHGMCPNRMVATCPAIMGNFYMILETLGYNTLVGFYPFEDICGPIRGADIEISGYELDIEVHNFFIMKNEIQSDDFVKERIKDSRGGEYGK